jgi:hypothetical protein
MMQDYDLLPMSFSTICASYGGITSVLEKYCAHFRENLDRVSGRIELGVKVFFRFGANEDRPKDGRILAREYMMNLYGSTNRERSRGRAVFRHRNVS